MPPAKYQRSPTPTSSTKLRPRGSIAVMRAVPEEHVGPFRLLVPVKLADAARVQPHVHARDCFRNAKPRAVTCRSPAAARLPNMGIGEGKPEIRQSSRIGCRRIEEIRI